MSCTLDAFIAINFNMHTVLYFSYMFEFWLWAIPCSLTF